MKIVKVRLFADFREMLGVGEMVLRVDEDFRIIDVLKKVDEKLIAKGERGLINERGELDIGAVVYVNERRVFSKDLLNKIPENAVVAVLPPMSGGRDGL